MIELQSHMMEERQISRRFFLPQEASLEYLPTLYLSDNNFNEIYSFTGKKIENPLKIG